MAFQEAIRQTPEYQAMQAQGNGQATTQQQGQTQVQTPGEIDAIVSLEKTDLEFWLQVATFFLLYLIYRELQRGGR